MLPLPSAQGELGGTVILDLGVHTDLGKPGPCVCPGAELPRPYGLFTVTLHSGAQGQASLSSWGIHCIKWSILPGLGLGLMSSSSVRLGQAWSGLRLHRGH